MLTRGIRGFCREVNNRTVVTSGLSTAAQLPLR